MTIWVDAHLSPRIALWISANYPVTAQPLREIGLRDAGDDEVFAAARTAGIIVLACSPVNPQRFRHLRSMTLPLLFDPPHPPQSRPF